MTDSHTIQQFNTFKDFPKKVRKTYGMDRITGRITDRITDRRTGVKQYASNLSLRGHKNGLLEDKY